MIDLDRKARTIFPFTETFINPAALGSPRTASSNVFSKPDDRPGEISLELIRVALDAIAILRHPQSKQSLLALNERVSSFIERL